MIVKKIGNGDLYVYRRADLNKPLGRWKKESFGLNWFIVKPNANSKNTGVIDMNSINFLPEYVGKKVRIKIEIIDEKEE
jgi:hypothetical protein